MKKVKATCAIIVNEKCQVDQLGRLAFEHNKIIDKYLEQID